MLDSTSGVPNSKKKRKKTVTRSESSHEPPWEQRQRRWWPVLYCTELERTRGRAWQRPFTTVPRHIFHWGQRTHARAHGALTTAEPPCPAVSGAAGIRAALSASLPAAARPCGPPHARPPAGRIINCRLLPPSSISFTFTPAISYLLCAIWIWI